MTYFKLDISLFLIYSVVKSDRGIKKVAWRMHQATARFFTGNYLYVSIVNIIARFHKAKVIIPSAQNLVNSEKRRK
ncbi:MAG: hypothetical protein C4542_04950 [Dehalococcoidia bacterium]|nr:MAG: hypothetical protein C4542_04950 [Dehalococcoidia bacterium]